MTTTANFHELEERFASAVTFSRRPVAVSFLQEIPVNLEKFEGGEPSSCSFWRLAAAGRVFYTLPENHFNCAVGAYTHNIALSPEREKETGETLKFMFDLGYVKPEEVPQIPRLAKTPVAILYAPLAESPVTPSVVLFACKPSGAMLLSEAANRAGVASGALLFRWARYSVWGASEIAFTPGCSTTKCILCCAAKISPQLLTPSRPSRPRTAPCSSTRKGVARISQAFRTKKYALWTPGLIDDA
jgi:uncharacterized protein (DUF169 family)